MIRADRGIDVMAQAANELQHFASGEYRIRSIELDNGMGPVTPLYGFEGLRRREAVILHFGKPFCIRVEYECLLPELPEFSCGVACALTYEATMEQAMYFNTNYPHTDAELGSYFEAKFRKFRGRYGVVEGTIDKLQLKPADYFLSIGILANRPGPHEFYELHYLDYRIRVESDAPDFPALFYANVDFLHGPLEEAETSVTPEMIKAGTDVIGSRLPPGIEIDQRTLCDIYLAMKDASDKREQ